MEVSEMESLPIIAVIVALGGISVFVSRRSARARRRLLQDFLDALKEKDCDLVLTEASSTVVDVCDPVFACAGTYEQKSFRFMRRLLLKEAKVFYRFELEGVEYVEYRKLLLEPEEPFLRMAKELHARAAEIPLAPAPSPESSTTPPS
jgi:hypothetical protein